MSTTTLLDVSDDVTALTHDGITARRAVFPVPWVDRMHADVMAAFDEARSRDGGPSAGVPSGGTSSCTPSS